MITEKPCNTCKLILPVEMFSYVKQAKDNLNWTCRGCVAVYNKKYVAENWDRIYIRNRQWARDNPEKNKELKTKSRIKCKVTRKQYAEDNVEYIRQWQKGYYGRNKPTLAAKTRKRKQTDLNFKISCNLRSRLNDAIKKNRKSGSAVDDLGCSVQELKQHLEVHFIEGMSWDNWGMGSGKWNIDHIMPLAAFNLEDRQHFIMANHYLNLQPLWFEDNMRKGSKIPIIPENGQRI